MLLLSCNDNAERISDLEKELEILKENTEKQQCVVSLINAYNEKKQIVSATLETALNTAVRYWKISFADNTKIEILGSVITTLSHSESTDEYILALYDGQEIIFNSKEMIYPTGIVALTQERKFLRNAEISIEFRVNPSNAIFNYDANSAECQIQLDMTEKVSTYSYVTKPEKCSITRIEQAKDMNGEIKEGQYIAYIRDNNNYDPYKYKTALVLSSTDKNGEKMQLSSSTISLERKKDSGLPVVVINTENNAEILDKENWIPAQMKIDGFKQFDSYEGTTSIRGRGNSTWGYPKKPYALKLDTKSEILGMPSHKRWVLLANYMDRTLIRNYVAFEIAKRTELEWTPRGQFVEVVLNGDHLGNYFLCEQIKVDKNRVNITEMKSSDLDEESITGGYLIEMDTYYDEVNKFKSEIFDLPVMLKDPEEDVLQQEQFDYIQNYFNNFEKLLTAYDFATTREYASYISEISFIDWWIVTELTFNAEASHPKSTYFYKERSDVLKAGPVWDFDWGTFTHSTTFCVKDAIWYSQLFKDPVFVRKVKERWEILKPKFEEVTELIENEIVHLGVSAQLDNEMWSLQGSNNVNNDESLSQSDAIYLLRNNYENRMKWLDTQIKNL